MDIVQVCQIKAIRITGPDDAGDPSNFFYAFQLYPVDDPLFSIEPSWLNICRRDWQYFGIEPCDNLIGQKVLVTLCLVPLQPTLEPDNPYELLGQVARNSAPDEMSIRDISRTAHWRLGAFREEIACQMEVHSVAEFGSIFASDPSNPHCILFLPLTEQEYEQCKQQRFSAGATLKLQLMP